MAHSTFALFAAAAVIGFVSPAFAKTNHHLQNHKIASQRLYNSAQPAGTQLQNSYYAPYVNDYSGAGWQLQNPYFAPYVK